MVLATNLLFIRRANDSIANADHLILRSIVNAKAYKQQKTRVLHAFSRPKSPFHLNGHTPQTEVFLYNRSSPFTPEWPYPTDGSLSPHRSNPFAPEWSTPQTEVFTSKTGLLSRIQPAYYTETEAYAYCIASFSHNRPKILLDGFPQRSRQGLPRATAKTYQTRGGLHPNVRIHCLGHRVYRIPECLEIWVYTAW